MKQPLIALLIFASFATFAQEGWPEKAVAELVSVQGTTIFPENVVATIADVTSNAVEAAAVLAKAQAVQEAAAMVSNAVAGVEEIINGIEGVGYIRGHVLSFGAGLYANTNATASIVKAAMAGIEPGTGNTLVDLWTYFTEDPGVLPGVRYTRDLKGAGTNVWELADSVMPTPVLEQVQVGGTLYDAYRNRVSMPPGYASAFFRVYVDAAGEGDVIYLPVVNGVKVNGVEPLTATFIDGDDTFKFVGGVRVE